MHRILSLVLLVLAAGTACADQPLEARTEKKGLLDADAKCRLELVAGKVHVTQSSVGDFTVVATVRVFAPGEGIARERLAHVKVQITAEPKALTVKTLYDQESGLESLASLFRSRERGTIEVEYEVGVPPGVAVDVESVSAEVAVEPRAGPLVAKTVSGAIATRFSEGAQLTSVSGPVELKEPLGKWSVETVSGSVDVVLDHFGAHEGKASSTSGRITLLAHPKTAARITVAASSVSGAVKNDLGAEGGLPVTLSTVSGEISATVRP